MKIAISGSHGVGKTTLAKKLAEELGMPLISGVAREEAKRMGFVTTKGIKKMKLLDRSIYQLRVFFRQIQEEEKHYKGFISDRSVFDAVAYSMYYNVDHKVISMLLHDALSHSERYDLILLCPPPQSSPPADDGFRLTDKASQDKVAQLLYDLLRKAKCPVYELGLNRDEWFNRAMDIIVSHACKVELPAGYVVKTHPIYNTDSLARFYTGPKIKISKGE